MTIHFGDIVIGLWDADDLQEPLGKETADQHQGQDIAARFDYPGLGMLQTVGTGPGIGAILGFGPVAPVSRFNTTRWTHRGTRSNGSRERSSSECYRTTDGCSRSWL